MTNLNKVLKYIMCHIIWVISWQKNQYSKIWNSNQKILSLRNMIENIASFLFPCVSKVEKKMCSLGGMLAVQA